MVVVVEGLGSSAMKYKVRCSATMCKLIEGKQWLYCQLIMAQCLLYSLSKDIKFSPAKLFILLHKLI